jgi:putative intracellular protease/amidase
MQVKEVLLLLTDRWADWEASYAIAELNSTEGYQVKTISVDTNPKVSIGGLRAKIDYSLNDYQHFDNLAMLILPGGFSWGENKYQEIADFVKKVHESGTPIAAICGATMFLAKHGFLDNIKHTGDELDYFQEEMKNEASYKGQANFITTQLVNDGGFITANETAALEFALEIFRTLNIGTLDETDAWYDKFKHGMIR